MRPSEGAGLNHLDYGTCPTCRLLVVLSTHTCLPAWEVANREGEIVKTVFAGEADEAAERYRETNPSDGEAPDEVEVSVRRVGETKWYHFDVKREFDPVFTANVKSEPPEDWEAPE